MLKVIDKISKNEEANKLLPEFRKIERELENVELVCIKTDGTKYDSIVFRFHLNLLKKFIIMKLL